MDTQIWNILGNHLKGESDKDEEARLKQWLQQSPENQQILEDVKQIWEKTGNLDTSKWAPKVDLDEEWGAFKNLTAENDKVEKSKPLENDSSKGKTLAFPAWIYRVAAALVLGLGLAYYLNYTGGPALNKNIIVHNSHLEKTKVLLPDQSEIWLNQQSEISYDSDFGISHRTLSLQGEAFFDIQKSEVPFVINTNQTKTEVLGTAFNLRSFAEETELTLIRGSVAFSEKDNPDNKVILIPGERAIHQVGSDQILKSENSDANFIAWKEEVLVFDKTKLDEVITALEKYFDIKVEVNNLQLYDCRFTGRFYNPNLDVILEVLSASLNIKYTLKDNNVSLTGAGCPSN